MNKQQLENTLAAFEGKHGLFNLTPELQKVYDNLWKSLMELKYN